MYWFDDIIQDRKNKWIIQEKQDLILDSISRYCNNQQIHKNIVEFLLLRNKIDRNEARKLEQAHWKNKYQQYQKYKKVLDLFNHHFDVYLYDTIYQHYPNYCSHLSGFFQKVIQ